MPAHFLVSFKVVNNFLVFGSCLVPTAHFFIIKASSPDSFNLSENKNQRLLEGSYQ